MMQSAHKVWGKGGEKEEGEILHNLKRNFNFFSFFFFLKRSLTT